MIAQFVDPRRTFLFLKKYAFENVKSHALFYLAIAAFLVLWLGVHLNFTNPSLFSERTQVAYYFVTLFLSGCLSSGMLFSELGTKPKAIHHLLVPASTLEKFLTTLFFGVAVFFVSCSAVFSVVDPVAVAIANHKFGTHWEAINLLNLNKYENPFFEGPLTDLFYIYFPVQAIFILCSIFFKKHGLFKAIVTMGLLWVCFIALFLLLNSLLPMGRFSSSLDSYEILEPSGDNKWVVLPPVLVYGTVVFSKYLITPLLWTIAYFKFKEKEL